MQPTFLYPKEVVPAKYFLNHDVPLTPPQIPISATSLLSIPSETLLFLNLITLLILPHFTYSNSYLQ